MSASIGLQRGSSRHQFASTAQLHHRSKPQRRGDHRRQCDGSRVGSSERHQAFCKFALVPEALAWERCEPWFVTKPKLSQISTPTRGHLAIFLHTSCSLREKHEMCDEAAPHGCTAQIVISHRFASELSRTCYDFTDALRMDVTSTNACLYL